MKNKRDKIKAKFNGKCAYCGNYLTSFEVDHFFALHREENFPKSLISILNDYDNLVPACRSCNRAKISNIEYLRKQVINGFDNLYKKSALFRKLVRFGMIERDVIFEYEKEEHKKEYERLLRVKRKIDDWQKENNTNYNYW